MSVRGIRIMVAFAVVILAVYWTIWFTQRSWVENDTAAAYVAFGNAFPLAGGWLELTCVFAFIALGRRSPAAGTAGLYLFGMDVLHDRRTASTSRAPAATSRPRST